ncbi:MAG TPA: FRG domain-containing protein [Fimbriimonadaceae bacterium]|nr:FRG domain-containing protein [Fimbriimonadaceae bacterium]
MHGVAWRGQGDARWTLASSAFRAERRRMLFYGLITGERNAADHLPCVALSVEDRMAIASRQVQLALGTSEHFRVLFRDELAAKDIHERPERYNELLSIAQHFGMSTPLLDVTYSAYVALFFAARDALASGRRGRIGVWRIPAYLWRQPQKRFLGVQADAREVAENQERYSELADTNLGSESIEVTLENVFPRSYRNERLVAQQGSFVRVTPDLPLDHVLSVFFDESATLDFSSDLQLFTLPAEGALVYLQQLNKMNISAQTLFPDLSGHMESVNLSLDHYDYRGIGDHLRGSELLPRARQVHPSRSGD